MFLVCFFNAEARQHGVGFYSFSKNADERAKQMEELERLRKQTEAARAQVVQSTAQKRDTLEARLQKVRDRKRAKLGLPPLSMAVLFISLIEYLYVLIGGFRGAYSAACCFTYRATGTRNYRNR